MNRRSFLAGMATTLFGGAFINKIWAKSTPECVTHIPRHGIKVEIGKTYQTTWDNDSIIVSHYSIPSQQKLKAFRTPEEDQAYADGTLENFDARTYVAPSSDLDPKMEWDQAVGLLIELANERESRY